MEATIMAHLILLPHSVLHHDLYLAQLHSALARLIGMVSGYVCSHVSLCVWVEAMHLFTIVCSCIEFRLHLICQELLRLPIFEVSNVVIAILDTSLVSVFCYYCYKSLVAEPTALHASHYMRSEIIVVCIFFKYLWLIPNTCCISI